MTRVEYELIRSGRKTVGIIVHRDGRVVVRAPRRLPAAEIERVVSEKAGWIRKKQEALMALPPLPAPARYANGEEHLYLGRPYQLQLEQHHKEGVTLADGRLLMRVKDVDDAARKEAVLDRWYRERAKSTFAERLAAVYPATAQHGIPYPQLRIRLMKTRWGSCSSKGNVNLNLRLIQTPTACIDYVIVHELAHFREPNHSRAYYELLEQLMPDWRMRRDELQRFPVR